MICATHAADRPLVVQFAASNADDFGMAAEMVAPYADAVDLNCGGQRGSHYCWREAGREGREGRGGDAVDLNCGCPQRSAGQSLREGRGGEGREAVDLNLWMSPEVSWAATTVEGGEGRGGEGMRWT